MHLAKRLVRKKRSSETPHHTILQLCSRPASTPLSECSKISNSVRASNLGSLPPAVHSNCSEAVCLAARTLLLADLRSAFLHSIVIFIKYREVSTIRYCQISSVIAETALYSRFGGH